MTRYVIMNEIRMPCDGLYARTTVHPDHAALWVEAYRETVVNLFPGDFGGIDLPEQHPNWQEEMNTPFDQALVIDEGGDKTTYILISAKMLRPAK